MKILHIIAGLNIGGAELMLKRLVELQHTRNDCQCMVISLTSIGEIGARLQAQGVTVLAIGMRTVLDSPCAMWRLFRLIRTFRPDVVQTWMYHADLLGGLAARLFGSCAVVWCVRSTAIPQGVLSFTYWLVRLCSIFSYFIPNEIICCANSSKIAHIKLGYFPKKILVIPNGYEFSSLEFDSNQRLKTRLELSIKPEDIIIGVVGRFDPLKDFHNFVSAASFVAAERSDVKFLMVGCGNEWSNPALCGWIENMGLTDRFYLVGQKRDVPNFLSAMDIFCLSSVNEAFPNVVVEAMAMGLPCVVTRAGDAADILDDDNFVVPVKNAVSLAKALLKICQLDLSERKVLGDRNAKIVRNKYDIETISHCYDNIYNEIKN